MNDAPPRRGPDTQAHYSKLATQYDSLWEHSSIFRDWMVDQILARVHLVTGDTIADVGGGTGIYASALLDRVPGVEVTLIDPSAEMLEQVHPRDRLTVLHASGASAPDRLRRIGSSRLQLILVKEAVHHFDEIPETLANLAKLLQVGGSMLIVMLPQRIDYPLFDGALRRFTELQPDPTQIQGAMQAAGLAVERTQAGYRLDIARERWLAMVGGRFMSLLSAFGDGELDAGLKEIQSRWPDAEVFSFFDTFEFILGVRSPI